MSTSASTPNAVTVSKPAAVFFGMTVDVLEGIQPPVAGRHQLDDADRRMTREARGLLEFGPAPVVGVDFAGQTLDELARPDRLDRAAECC